jgi:hypothetical protein
MPPLQGLMPSLPDSFIQENWAENDQEAGDETYVM